MSMLQNQRKLCGANSAAIDLLPPPGPGAEWTKDLPIDQGREADQVCFFFRPISSTPECKRSVKALLLPSLFISWKDWSVCCCQKHATEHIIRSFWSWSQLTGNFSFLFVTNVQFVSRFTCLMDQQALKFHQKWCHITWRRTSRCLTGWSTNTTPVKANTSKSISSATLMTTVSTSSFFRENLTRQRLYYQGGIFYYYGDHFFM